MVAVVNMTKPIEPRVLLCIPESRGAIATEMAVSLMHLARPDGAKIYAETGGRTVSELRNNCCAVALDQDFTHVAMFDTDMIYPENTLTSLLSRDVDVICAFACTRKPPHQPIFGPPSDDLGGSFWSQWPTEDGEPTGERLHGAQPTGIVGGGALVIRTDVLRALERPWFETAHDEKWVGEDMYFSRKLRAAGVQTYCDVDVWLPHQVTGWVQPFHDPKSGRWGSLLHGVKPDMIPSDGKTADQYQPGADSSVNEEEAVA